jgi:hypothetical protein
MINWVHSVDDAVQSAKSSQKLVLLDFFHRLEAAVPRWMP